jgi:hypothetical protein
MTVQAPATSSNRVLTLEDTDGTLAPLVSGTAQAASGTSVDFTGIPSWAKRITVCAYGLSTNGTSSTIIRVGGTANGVLSAGYFGLISYFSGSAATTGVSPNGLYISVSTAAGLVYGSATLTRVVGNKWVWSGTFGRDDTTDLMNTVTGGIELAEPLTTIRYTTFSGTEVFDAGTVNILYE